MSNSSKTPVKNFLRFDIHSHILPPPALLETLNKKFNTNGFLYLEPGATSGCSRLMKNTPFFKSIQENYWHSETRVQESDVAGIDVQVLSTAPIMFSYYAPPAHTLYLSQVVNDHIASAVKAYPKRFIGLATLPMQSPELAIQELERAKKIGLSGIEIGTHIDTENEKWNLNHPQVFAVLEAAADLGMSVFVHPWDMLGEEQMSQYCLPALIGMPAETSLAICSLIFGGVFERLPHLRMAFAHGGGSFGSAVGRIAHGYGIKPELCALDNAKNPRDYCGRFWVDTLVHDERALQYVIDLFGAEKVALGTDYPFVFGEYEPRVGGAWQPGKIIQGFPSALQKTLCCDAACSWLAVEPSQFLR